MRSTVTKIIKKGNTLLAEPLLNEDPFARSVVYLTSHGREGTLGFILNQPTGLVLGDLISDLEVDLKIYRGGPVKPYHLYYVHKRADLIEDATPVVGDIFLAGDFSRVKARLLDGSLNAENIKFFLGCSSWGSEQLKAELGRSVWVMLDRFNPNLFSDFEQNLWRSEMIRLGGSHLIWANAPRNPNWN